MTDTFNITCPKCKNTLEMEGGHQDWAGQTFSCPECQTQITIPPKMDISIKKSLTPKQGAKTELCGWCGSELLANTSVCPSCRRELKTSKIVENKNQSLKASSQSPAQRKCPQCQGKMGQNDVLCVNCGFDFRKPECNTSIAIPEQNKQTSEPKASPSKKMRQCPYCGEDILAVAKKCKYCGEFLDKKLKPRNAPAQPQAQSVITASAFRRPPSRPKKMTQEQHAKGILLVIFALVFTIGFLWTTFSDKGSSTNAGVEKKESTSYWDGYQRAQSWRAAVEATGMHKTAGVYEALAAMKESKYFTSTGDESDFDRGFKEGWELYGY